MHSFRNIVPCLNIWSFKGNYKDIRRLYLDVFGDVHYKVIGNREIAGNRGRGM